MSQYNVFTSSRQEIKNAIDLYYQEMLQYLTLSRHLYLKQVKVFHHCHGVFMFSISFVHCPLGNEWDIEFRFTTGYDVVS